MVVAVLFLGCSTRADEQGRQPPCVEEGSFGSVSSEDVLTRISAAWSRRGRWELVTDGLGETTRLGTFPPVTNESGKPILAAVEPRSGASVLILLVPERLGADADTRDALAVASPTVVSDGWGADFRTIWADLAYLSGRRVIRVQGGFETSSGRKVSLFTWIPDGRRHYLVAVTTRPTEAGYAKTLARVISQEVLSDESLGLSREQAIRLALALALGSVLLVGLMLFARQGAPWKRADK